MQSQKLNIMDKNEWETIIDEAVNYIKSRVDFISETAIVLGSGLGNLSEQVQEAAIIPFEEIPGFPVMTVEGHSGRLIFGKIEEKQVIIMQGRYHYYEGYEVQQITLPIRVLGALGVKTLILTNACGGINEAFSPGELVLIEDHLALFCPSPLRGAPLDKYGPRFTDMSKPYDREYIQLAERCAKNKDISVSKGVYGYWTGPTYETAAEIRAYKALGADMVGMSTVAETIVAVNHGIRVLGISAVTNMTCIISKSKTSHEEVIKMGQEISGKFTLLIKEILKEI